MPSHRTSNPPRPQGSAGIPHAVPAVTTAASDGPNPNAPPGAVPPGPISVPAEPAVTRLPCPDPGRLGGCADPDDVSPAQRYRELFVAVQTGGIFADSKTFPDCVPLAPPAEIRRRYRQLRERPGFSLQAFVAEHFARSQVPDSHYVSVPGQTLHRHIEALWPVLTRDPVEHRPGSSLLPLPLPYVVPGGRFSELYYWDSFFVMLGLVCGGRHDLVRAMADNFAYLLGTYGMIPNGTRSYYLSRSQPPVFTLMTELFEAHGVLRARSYLPYLRAEHAWWMDGAERLDPGTAHRRAVRLQDGTLLNRYWDDHARPREEAFVEDLTTAQRSARPHHLVFRDIRAAAESGWDFSSRWLDADENGQPLGMPTIRTTAILPIDLNCLLWHTETRIAQLSERQGDEQGAHHYAALADARRRAIERHLWRPASGAFVDFDWQRGMQRPGLTAATLMPLFVGLASHQQAARIAATVREQLLREGGLATTCLRSGEQWDRPNGWAPLQWIAVEGLRRYGFHDLARAIAHRWLVTVSSLYRRERKLVEKYRLRRNPARAVGGGGGEYPLQDGFGWTNGVTAMLLQAYPDSLASAAPLPGIGT
ncbi:alpha,alpha-trehalase TreF [Cupriavidus sp. AU9028]|uniref:alpha,alpha-trehalase TreF n=1 Tax=Cupriavidus sp. AU9028 TaxID=2871157 RepID=UPI001C98D886|nr:alpha,alpha-trehalase TreF [Cupriavidus sp. AU9028]MBY4895845.1 alpha,alpha-trehalase TreF [Cupriavidus sp. AU9028]